MASCELCGKPATTKARVEGVVFAVCASCAKLGHEFGETPRAVMERKAASRPSQPRPHAPATDTYLAIDYGQRLRKARQKMGLTEKDAALKLNMREIELLHYESGKLQPNETVAKKLEKFYTIKLYEQA
jgi:putative transcription factor